MWFLEQKKIFIGDQKLEKKVIKNVKKWFFFQAIFRFSRLSIFEISQQRLAFKAESFKGVKIRRSIKETMGLLIFVYQ